MVKNISKKQSHPLTYAEIDLKAINHNIKVIRQLVSRNEFLIPGRKAIKTKSPIVDILPVIKAEAYGHGMKEVAELLSKQGVCFFGVSDIKEGIQLRQLGLKKSILLFETTLPDNAKDLVQYRLMPSICNLSLAQALNDYGERRARTIDIHIKVDTGMGRLGVWHEDAYAFVKKINKLTRLRIMGIFTHFPAAETDISFTQKQIQSLYDLVLRLDKKGIVIPYIHAANSMGLGGYVTKVLNLSRPGLMVYGLYPHPSLKKKINLKPAMSVKSLIIFIKDIPKGQSISYGRTFFTKKKMRVGVVPMGYSEGYFRAFSNKASVLINGIQCRVLGRVTMDQIIVDLTQTKAVKIGTPVTILGTQKKATVSADDLASWAKTINYEIVCALGNQLPRIYKK